MYLFSNPFSSADETAEFPALTICPDYHVAYDRYFLNQFNTTVANMRKLDFPNNTNMTAAEFYDNASHSLKELLNYIEVRTYAKSEEDDQKLPWFIFVLSSNDTDIYKHSKVPLDKNNTSKIYYDSEKYFVLQNLLFFYVI